MDLHLQDTRHRIDRLQSEVSARLQHVDEQYERLQQRMEVLTRVLVLKQVISAEELARLIAAEGDDSQP